MNRRTFIRNTALATGLTLGDRWSDTLLGEESKMRSFNRLLDTPANRALSPLTGYTRAHWIEIAGRLLAGALPHLDPATGLPRFLGVTGDRGHVENIADKTRPIHWQAMERIMMLAVYYSAATGRDRVPGWDGSGKLSA